jgi:hypothetical protein
MLRPGIDFNWTTFWLTCGEPMRIDLKLCTHVPLGQRLSGNEFWPNLILGLATRGPKPKTQKVLQLLK